MTINIVAFCAGEREQRDYLQVPFSRGDFSYATDGCIMVRVARNANYDGDGRAIKDPNKPLEGIEGATFWKAPQGDFPLDAHKDCPACNGRGNDHDCPDCYCTCTYCEGLGKKGGKTSVSIKGVPFALHYITKLLTLPEIEIAEDIKPDVPLLFRFAGGIGSLMPLRSEYRNHLGSIGQPAHTSPERQPGAAAPAGKE